MRIPVYLHANSKIKSLYFQTNLQSVFAFSLTKLHAMQKLAHLLTCMLGVAAQSEERSVQAWCNMGWLHRCRTQSMKNNNEKK